MECKTFRGLVQLRLAFAEIFQILIVAR